ncbi:RNA polymerase sigma factor [Muriicola sp. Z0-33]|uniref:RNA polymerase sigma factor n=1 Tax=Muriicola sp. Z0-33 TaxID=2816957 RepID=UPI002238D044|nr:RNA polymerase sigma factor [Muriicola sp. Z0-33]MCW5516473.1 RNA polymerase sigma factor [Muriicola sp. Z0-33]
MSFLKERPDEELMAAVAGGNLDLAKILFERHHVHIYNFLYKMSKDKMLSEDITQEVFYKLIKYRSSYNNGKFVSWMFTIARNCLASHYKSSKGIYTNLDQMEYRLTEDQNEKIEDYTHLQQALDKLNNSDRELLILNRLQEIKYNELAEIMDSTTGAVKTKVSRALKKLKGIYFEKV